MRTRRDIEKDYKQTDMLILEVLLDVRDLLAKANKKPRRKPKKKVGNASSK